MSIVDEIVTNVPSKSHFVSAIATMAREFNWYGLFIFLTPIMFLIFILFTLKLKWALHVQENPTK